MTIYEQIRSGIENKGALFFILIDPDKLVIEKTEKFVNFCSKSGVDGFLIGGSLMIEGDLDASIKVIKQNCGLPVIVFPGSVNQVSQYADAILFISLISGRNAEHLIGKHVHAAPIIKKYNIEPISTGYMLIESGQTTTAEYISESKPIPRNKYDIASATALAGEYLGMKLIYLEGGSGAEFSVPDKLIAEVAKNINIPIIVGGGITTPTEANNKVRAGARVIIMGNFFENENNWDLIPEFAAAIHSKSPIQI